MALIRAIMLCNKSEFRSGQENVPTLKRLVLREHVDFLLQLEDALSSCPYLTVLI